MLLLNCAALRYDNCRLELYPKRSITLLIRLEATVESNEGHPYQQVTLP